MTDQGVQTMTITWKQTARALLVAVLAVLVWVFPASAFAQARPDLVVSRVFVTGGAHPYLLVDPFGNTQPFQVHVTTKNVGDATAGPSETKVTLLGGFPHQTTASVLVPVGRLGPRGTDTTITSIGAHPGFKLGFVSLYTHADAKNAVPESNKRNNLRKWREIPVLARRWLIFTFQTHEVSSFSNTDVLDRAQTAASSNFQFTRFDASTDSFVYSATAKLIETVQSTVGGCTAMGQGMATQNPWPLPSELRIRGNLTSYSAMIDTTNEPPFTITDSCGGMPTFKFISLETESGSGPVNSMRPWYDELKDSGSIGSFLKTDWTWDFLAGIP
jgi:CARDB